MKKIVLLLIAFPCILFAQKKTDDSAKSVLLEKIPQTLESVLSGIKADVIYSHVQKLASDSFEGRKPGTQFFGQHYAWHFVHCRDTIACG